MERIEADLRAAPVLAALRLALLHALIPSSRLASGAGRGGALRVAGGHVRLPGTSQWRERNPWLAFEDGFRQVRGFVQHLEGGALGPAAGSPRRGPAGTRGGLRYGGAGRLQSLGRPGVERRRSASTGRAHRTRRSAWSWASRRCARASSGSRSPTSVRRGPSGVRRPHSCRSTPWPISRCGRRGRGRPSPSGVRWPQSSRRWPGTGASSSSSTAGPRRSRPSRSVRRPPATASSSRASRDPDDAGAGVIELVPPGAAVPPGPRTRANVALPYSPGGSGDPDIVPGKGLFAPPERFDQRPFSPSDAAKVVSEAAIETLRARGEPARMERLFGEILVGLDRSGHLRRLSAGTRPSDVSTTRTFRHRPRCRRPRRCRPAPPPAPPPSSRKASPDPVITRRAVATAEAGPDPVERLLGADPR